MKKIIITIGLTVVGTAFATNTPNFVQGAGAVWNLVNGIKKHGLTSKALTPKRHPMLAKEIEPSLSSQWVGGVPIDPSAYEHLWAIIITELGYNPISDLQSQGVSEQTVESLHRLMIYQLIKNDIDLLIEITQKALEKE